MFAGYWVAVSNKEQYYVVSEIYKPNVIISDAAKMIKDREKELGIKTDEYLGPSDMWNRRQETGKSVADIFYDNGIRLHRTSRDRIDGWAATKEFLKPYVDEQGVTVARLRIFENCVNLIRCLPALQFDEKRPSDAATTPHEITHAPDAIRGFCVYRSRANRERLAPTDEQLWEERQYQRFNSPDIFDVYKRREDDYDNSSYNPMYL